MSFVKLTVLLLPGLYNCTMEPESQALADDDECTAADCMLSALQVRGKRLESYSMAGDLETHLGDLEGDPQRYVARSIVADQGAGVGACRGGDRWGKGCTDLKGCERLCDENPRCQSFSFGVSRNQKGKCYLKSKHVTAKDPPSYERGHQNWRTYYKAAPYHYVFRYVERSIVADQGAGVGACRGGDRWGKGCTDLEGCERLCDANPRCHSFSFGVGGAQEGKCYLKSKHVTADDPPSYKQGHSDWRTYYMSDDGGIDDETSQPYDGGNSHPDPQQRLSDATDRAASAEARAKAAEARAAEAEAQSRMREAEARAAEAEARAKAAEARARDGTTTTVTIAQAKTTAPASQSSPGPSPATPDLSKMFDPKTWSDPNAMKKMMDPNLWKGMMGR